VIHRLAICTRIFDGAMSRSVNKAVLIGHTGADPELRTTSSGTRVATFSLATSRWSGAKQEGHERTEWHRVVAWDALAQVVERSVRKGDRVYVEGSLEYRSWQDAAGRTRFVTEINAQEVIPLSEMRSEPPVWRPGDEARETRARPLIDDDLPF
jgi:single stranded DNA-binding protein